MGRKSRHFRKRGTILFAIILSLVTFRYVQAGENIISKWTHLSSSVNSDLKFIAFLTPEYGIASGKQILILKNGRWIRYPHQPPVPVNLICPVDTGSFFISTITKYQESELYFGDGQHWEKVWAPLANSIITMYFTGRNNGVIAGLGEIAVLKNNRWRWLPPPGNHPVTSVVPVKDSVIYALVRDTGLFKYDADWKKIRNSGNITHFKYLHDTLFVLGNDFYGFVNVRDSVIKVITGTGLRKIRSFLPFNKNEAVAVGSNGLILHFKNGRWKRIESGVTENLNAVCSQPGNGYWIAGDNGALLTSSPDYLNSLDAGRWKGFKVIEFKEFAKVIDDEYGVVAADFNNDGLTDIFTCGLFEANHLYINKGKNTFIDKASHWNVSGEKSTNFRELNLGACAADFDNNGYQDIYVTSLNGRNKLYKNIRGNYFVDYSEISRGTGNENDRTNAVIAGDVDNDGDLDIFITNENTTNRLYLNNGAGIFSEEMTESAGLTTDFGGMGCSFGDIDNDGDLDLYVANWSAQNILYRNLLKETGKLVFENITDKAGVGGEVYAKSNAVVFADMDNDTDLDLFVTNRKTSNKLYINNGNGIFTDETGALLGIDTLKSYGAVIVDFDGDGFKDIYVSNVGRNVFYKNIKGVRFVDNTSKYGAGVGGYSTGSAAADFDNDGNIDLYVANYIGESSVLLHNNNPDGHFIRVHITGFENNRDGTGAKLYVYSDGGLNKMQHLISYTEISGGSGYASMNQRFLPVAVPGQEFVDVKIVFPDGKIKTVKHAGTGSTLLVEDETGTKKNLLLAGHWWKREVKNPHKLLRMIAWLIVLSVIVFSMQRGFKRYNWSWLFITAFSLLLLLLFYTQSTYFEFRNILFSGIFPVLSIIILVSLVHLYFERRSIKTAALAEQEHIRENLSRDLHDDLASTISAISIYLTLIRYQLKNTEKKLTGLLDKTMALSGDASLAMTDLIWAIKPKPQSLDNLIGRINNNFSTLFREKGIEFSTYKTDTGNVVLNTQAKKNVYLIIKEALNNILKYAEASTVSINIVRQKPDILLTITDNGKGFDTSKAKGRGHGLTNMHTRASEIDAQFEIKSVNGKGTEIRLVFHPGRVNKKSENKYN